MAEVSWVAWAVDFVVDWVVDSKKGAFCAGALSTAPPPIYAFREKPTRAFYTKARESLIALFARESLLLDGKEDFVVL